MDYFLEMKKLNGQLHELIKHEMELIINNSDKIEELEEYKKKVREVSGLLKEIKVRVVKLSLFDLEEVGNIFASLVSEFEGEEYVFSKIDDEFVIASKVFIENEKNLKKIGCSRDVILLDEVNDKNLLRFYSFYIGGKLNMMDCRRFTYLGDFINYVINYRMNNKDDNCYDLVELKNEFLLLKREEIGEWKNHKLTLGN